jgi:predicted alpha/beta superfamily hydrolase
MFDILILSNKNSHEEVMKKVCTYLLLAIVFACVSATSQTKREPISIGEKILIHSDILDESRELLVYLPQNYDQSKENYPVLYLLDGEWHFIHVSGAVQFLARPRVEKIPKMMVVAIVNTSRGRDFSPSTWPGYRTYTGGADNFIRFLKTELFPFIDKNYRTQAKKILAGHSLAGTFTLYTFLTQPDIFDGYIALSPCLFWHDRFMLKKSEEFMAKYEKIDKTLFIAHEYTGGEEASTMEEFVDLMQTRTPLQLRWKSILIDKDTHFTYVHKAIYDGLEFTFSTEKN